LALAGLGAVLVLGLAACSVPVKIPAAEIPPEQYLDMNCDALSAADVRLLAERDELNTPLPSLLRRRLNEKLSSPN